MSRIISSLMLLAIAPAAVLGASAAPSSASMSAGPMIATVNFSSMINAQDPRQSPLKQWAETVNNIQHNMEKKSEEINKLREQIDSKAEGFQKASKDGKLTEAQNKELLDMYTNLQTKAQNIQGESQQAYMKAGEELKKDIEQAAASVASKKGFDLVINAEVVVYSKNAKDITQEVIGELNKKHDSKKAAERAKGGKAGK